MEFDKMLKLKLEKEYIERIGRYLENIKNENVDSTYDIPLVYAVTDILYEHTDGDINNISSEELNELLKKIEFTEDERYYLAYENIKGSNTNHLLNILLRRKLIQGYNNEDCAKIIETIKAENPVITERVTSVINLLEKANWPKKDEINRLIDEKAEVLYNGRINCGGYALKVDSCVWPSNSGFEGCVTGILENFPFVRLIGDSELAEDEYLVAYRISENGHHFIRMEEDGTITEKCSAEPPKNFEGWDADLLLDGREAVFAVKKEHDMGSESVVIEGMNFEQTVKHVLSEGNNTFEYHCHKYSITENGGENIVINDAGEKVADVVSNDQEYSVRIDSDKEDFISNTKSDAFERYGKHKDPPEDMEI